MSAVHGQQPLHGIENPLGAARDALARGLRLCGGKLSGERYDDALSFLYLELRRMAQLYEQRRDEAAAEGETLKLSFSSVVHRWLPLRLVNWYRAAFGDRRYGYDGMEESVADPGELLTAAAAIDPQSFVSLVDDLDHERLSPRARSTLRFIAVRMAEEGITASQAALELGKTRREVSRDLARLRDELQAVAA